MCIVKHHCRQSFWAPINVNTDIGYQSCLNKCKQTGQKSDMVRRSDLCIKTCSVNAAFNSDMNLDLILSFLFCLQSVWMQYYRETESDPDFSSEIKPITPERTAPEL